MSEFEPVGAGVFVGGLVVVAEGDDVFAAVVGQDDDGCAPADVADEKGADFAVACGDSDDAVGYRREHSKGRWAQVACREQVYPNPEFYRRERRERRGEVGPHECGTPTGFWVRRAGSWGGVAAGGIVAGVWFFAGAFDFVFYGFGGGNGFAVFVFEFGHVGGEGFVDEEAHVVALIEFHQGLEAVAVFFFWPEGDGLALAHLSYGV